MSLHRNIVHKLLNSLNLVKNYKEALFNGTIRLIKGAPDEFIIPHIIINDIFKKSQKNIM